MIFWICSDGHVIDVTGSKYLHLECGYGDYHATSGWIVVSY